MFAAALIDLGADFNKIKQSVESLIPEIELKYEKSQTYGICAGRFSVIDKTTAQDADCSHGHHFHRHLLDIVSIFEKSNFDNRAKKAAIDIFTIIARAEGQVHGTDVESVHFHEVGALDSIGDIAASVLAFYEIGADVVYSSPINTGSGTVKCAHGVLPAPAPASLKLLKGIPAYSDGTQTELATPTGITLLKYFTTEFCRQMPVMTVLKDGGGMGTKNIGRPNIFRAVLGEGLQ